MVKIKLSKILSIIFCASLASVQGSEMAIASPLREKDHSAPYLDADKSSDLTELLEKFKSSLQKKDNIVEISTRYNEAALNAPYSHKGPKPFFKSDANEEIYAMFKDKSLASSIIYKNIIPTIKPEDIKDGFSLEQAQDLISKYRDDLDYFRNASKNLTTATQDTPENQTNYFDVKEELQKADNDFNENIARLKDDCYEKFEEIVGKFDSLIDEKQISKILMNTNYNDILICPFIEYYCLQFYENSYENSSYTSCITLLLKNKNILEISRKGENIIQDKESLDIDYPIFKGIISSICDKTSFCISNILYDEFTSRSPTYSSIAVSIYKSLKAIDQASASIIQELKAVERAGNLDEITNAFDQIRTFFASFSEQVLSASPNVTYLGYLSEARDELNKASILFASFKQKIAADSSKK